MTRQEIESLIKDFNEQVGSRAWTSARAESDNKIIQQLINSGIDISSIYDGTKISFAKKIYLSEDGLKIITAE